MHVLVEARVEWRFIVIRFADPLGVGMVPVHDGMVEAEGNSGILACVGQFLHRIPLERSGLHDRVVAHFRVEHAESVVVLARDDDVFHAGVPGYGHPLLRVELYRVELSRQLLIIRHRDVGVVHDPLADPGGFLPVPFTRRDGIQSPMNEHSKSSLSKPLHASVVLGGCFGCAGSCGFDRIRKRVSPVKRQARGQQQEDGLGLDHSNETLGSFVKERKLKERKVTEAEAHPWTPASVWLHASHLCMRRKIFPKPADDGNVFRFRGQNDSGFGRGKGAHRLFGVLRLSREIRVPPFQFQAQFLHLEIGGVKRVAAVRAQFAVA